jgi:hypothetical protein
LGKAKVWGRGNLGTGRKRGTVSKRDTFKKEEFPGFMENMRPGNSFPQICVVSVNKSVENGEITQDYRRSVTLSNLLY